MVYNVFRWAFVCRLNSKISNPVLGGSRKIIRVNIIISFLLATISQDAFYAGAKITEWLLNLLKVKQSYVVKIESSVYLSQFIVSKLADDTRGRCFWICKWHKTIKIPKTIIRHFKTKHFMRYDMKHEPGLLPYKAWVLIGFHSFS